MNQKERKIKFKKTVDAPTQTQRNPQKEKIIKRMMERFNITSEEAGKVLIKLEQDKQNATTSPQKQSSTKTQKDTNLTDKQTRPQNKIKKSQPENIYNHKPDSIKGQTQKIKLQKRDNVDVIIPEHQKQKQQPAEKPKKQTKKTKQQPTKKQQKPAEKPKKQTKDKKIQKQEPDKNKAKPEDKEQTPDEKPKQDVDAILTDLIPDYQQQISVEVEHADLTFEVETERIDTIKESFINFIKRKKNDKLAVHALNDISFKIYQGEKIGIIGYNGAGKSTLLKVIAGIYTPDTGKVTVNGRVSPLLSLGAGFDNNYTGRKNIMLNGAVLGYEKDFLESKMDEIIEFTELGDYIDLPIKNYSSGMLAKLGFAIATVVEPDILIIDEILSVGDITFKKKSRDKMRSLIDSGTTLILVSHSIPQIRELCDKAIWIDNGKVREIGEVNKVCEHYIKSAEKASNEQLANIKFR